MTYQPGGQLCDLKSLEILDLGRNMLQVLPPEIVKLSSLKVFSLPKNQITELPLCIADMPSLSVIKLEDNPLVFPPPDVVGLYDTRGRGRGASYRDGDSTEAAATVRIKKFLKQKATSMNGRADLDSPSDDHSEGTETPRPTIKRVFSGRFPIKVNGNDVPDLRSPALARPPPIPNRSHYRGLSQQNTAQRRPGVMPLTIGNPNERVRSNSETTIQTSSRERSESRSRRMGIVSKKPSELSTLNETEVNNRFSHYRGLSHGSAMQGNNGATMQAKSPNMGSSADGLQRPVYVRRLSILPERRRESKVYDPVVEAAKGILYSIFQIHPMIQMLMSLANDGSTRRSNLEIVFYNTNTQVEQLEMEIQKHDPTGNEASGQRENENVQRACITLVNAYTHVCALLMGNVDLFLDNGDARYIRTLLTQLYNSIMELRVTCNHVPAENVLRITPPAPVEGGDTLRPLHSREGSLAPNSNSGLLNGRPRNGTFIYNPNSLRVSTDVPMPYINGTGRTATISSATPRSGESFVSITSAGRTGDFTEEDRAFEKIYLSLQSAAEVMDRVMPGLNAQFTAAMRSAQNQRAPEHVIQCWQGLIGKCNNAIQQTEWLKSKLSSIKLKEPGIRTQPAFWALCNTFIDSWYQFVRKSMAVQDVVQLPLDTKARLRPVQSYMKETWEKVMASPWAYFAKAYEDNGITSPYPNQATTPLPMTPQSAALGPAVQATFPSTPQSGSFDAAFAGNVFQRADALISMGGLNMSRTGTMNSVSTASLNSMNSTLSHDSVMTPSSALSPGGHLPFRLNNGSKAGF